MNTTGRSVSIDDGPYVDAPEGDFDGVYINRGYSGDVPTSSSPPPIQMERILSDKEDPTIDLNSNNIDMDTVTKPLPLGTLRKGTLKPGSTSLVWNNLSYEVIKKEWVFKGGLPSTKTTLKQILKPQNGEIVGGTLTALMGPSGAGKSTLLNCLTGNYMRGVKGDIFITCRSMKPKATISFVPQKDNLYQTFTVEETLLFASKMKNLKPGTDHQAGVTRVLNDLNLAPCAGVYLDRCSGGQVKRVCIGVELISNPDILVLDEPTTGLDSSTAAQCVQLLRRLTELAEAPPAIVATIHQPNYKIFNEFHNVYLLSRNGQCVYFGSPLNIIPYFERYNLVCPSYCNPADYAIEVAYGDYGQEVFTQMEESNRMITYAGDGKGNRFDLQKVVFKLRNRPLPFIQHTMLLIKRNWQNLFRDSNQTLFKTIHSIVIAFIMSYLWVYSVGEDDGCWAAFKNPVNTTELKENLFKIDINSAKDEYLGKISRIADNSAFLFSMLIYVMMISLITCVLSFPLETSIILKELGNNWFKVSSYFWGRTISDFPLMLFQNALLVAIAYPLTGQIMVVWRIASFYTILCLASSICESFGMIMGILLNDDIVTAAMATVASSIPMLIFAGFFVRASGMPWYFKPFSYISYMKYSFENVVITIYGFDRCLPSSDDSFVDKLLKSQDPMVIASNLWSSFNITYKDVVRYSYLLNVPQDCLLETVNATIDYLGLDDNSGSVVEDIVDEIKPTEDPSYIMSYYELKDNTLYYNYGVLLVFLIVLKALIYIFLRAKTRTTN